MLTNRPDLFVRVVRTEDLPHYVKLHKAAYPFQHRSCLLTAMQLSALYEQVVQLNPYCYTAVDKEQNVCGFVVGGPQTSVAFRRFMRANLGSLLSCGLKHPLAGAGFLVNRLRNRAIQSRARTRLLSIAVDPKHQFGGVGSALLDTFEQNLMQSGVYLYGLCVHLGNKAALSFYESRGFQLEFAIRSTRYYIRQLAANERSPVEPESAVLRELGVTHCLAVVDGCRMEGTLSKGLVIQVRRSVM